MPLIEPDLEVFLADHGVPVVIGGTSTVGILDAPGVYVASDQVITRDYQLTVTAAAGSGLAYGAAVSANGTNYLVRDAMPLDDGAFVVLQLELAPAGAGPVGTGLTTLAGTYLVTAGGDYLITQ